VQRSSLSDIIKLVPGVAKCPYDPRQNNTYLMTADGTLYTATVTDFTGRDAAIYRSMGALRPLRTVQYNSRWLNGNWIWPYSCYRIKLRMRQSFHRRSYIAGSYRRWRQIWVCWVEFVELSTEKLRVFKFRPIFCTCRFPRIWYIKTLRTYNKLEFISNERNKNPDQQLQLVNQEQKLYSA
jgi:Sema domain